MVFLEELGATGNKGLTSLLSNPVIADGVAGLATSATAFAAIEVRWQQSDPNLPDVVFKNEQQLLEIPKA